MNNLEIRKAIQKNGLRHYEVAKLMNISEGTFGRKLRFEMQKEEKEKILKIIEKNKTIREESKNNEN